MPLVQVLDLVLDVLHLLFLLTKALHEPPVRDAIKHIVETAGSRDTQP